jgi:hypothetical protein
MKLAKCCLALLFLSVSVVILIFANLYDVKLDEDKDLKKSANENDDKILDDKPKNLLHFLQISDLHISKFNDPTRVTDFRKFCSEIVPAVNPKFVSMIMITPKVTRNSCNYTTHSKTFTSFIHIR